MKKAISAVLFCLLTVFCIARANDVLVDKSFNRYYMLEKELESRDEEYDVQIYGSCHAYTSFDPMYLVEEYGISAYNMSNPGEIIPATYLRMKEQFQKDDPQVAFVEIWGVNAYDTYIGTEDTLGSYFTSNVERLPLSLDKIEVINDFEALDLLNENFPIAKYKNRLLSNSLSAVDYDYSFELLAETYDPDNEGGIHEEMRLRFANNGYKPYAAGDVADYEEQQASPGGTPLEIEPDIMKYLCKIIDLCEEYNVTLILYRAPYRAKEVEVRKIHYMAYYCRDNRIPFVNLEAVIDYDYSSDFHDYEHLSESGAYKSTQYLCDYMFELRPDMKP